MPLPITHGNGGGIQPEDTSRQNLLGTQVRTPGSNVASFAQTVEKDPEFNAGVAMDGGKRDEISGVEGTDIGIDTRY